MDRITAEHLRMIANHNSLSTGETVDWYELRRILWQAADTLEDLDKDIAALEAQLEEVKECLS